MPVAAPGDPRTQAVGSADQQLGSVTLNVTASVALGQHTRMLLAWCESTVDMGALEGRRSVKGAAV